MRISPQSANMESENVTDPYEDNRHVDQSRQSLRSTKNDSQTSPFQKHEKIFRDKIQGEGEKDVCVESRSKTRTWRSDPDRDQVSDEEGRRSTGSLYSEDYENGSHSGRSSSPYSHSRTPSLTRGVRDGVPQRGVRAKRISNSPFYKAGGVGRRGVSRPQRPGGQPLTQQHRRGVRSQSKESTPPKDMDLVTKRMLSARLLKINELRNSLVELQQRTDELQKENRVLRQLQVRQEKALHRYDDTESEISQLLLRHTNETQVLRERLRRTQERERAAERRMKGGEEQLQRSQATAARLKKLVDQRDLGARDELSRRLDDEKTRAQEAAHRIKELERSVELSSSSYQRQLAAERKKTLGAQEEIRTLQEELERLTNKLKEKERELDAKNIYANRMTKPEKLRKDVDSGGKRKVPSRSSSKAVQTKDRASSLDFPTPPPATSDANECGEQAPDEYLSLKEFDRVDRRAETEDRHQKLEQQKMRDRRKEGEKEMVKTEQENEEKREVHRELNVLEEKAKTPRDGSEKKKEQDDGKRTTESSQSNQKEDHNRKHSHVQEEVERWNHGALANQQAAEEAHRKKQQLLAKMREIDRQEHGAQDVAFEPSPSEFHQAPRNQPSPRLPEQRNQNSHIFHLAESAESAGLRSGSDDAGRRRSGFGKRAPRTQIPTEDMAFGSYAPSFGHPASRGSSGFPPPPPKEDRESALEAIGVFSLRGVETEREKETDRGAGKEKKSSLMQQLFGALATPAGDGVSASNNTEVLNSPPTTNGAHPRREGLFNSGPSTPPSSSLNTLHVTDSRPAIRAIASFDDDIEELTL
ncbi:lebercilin [Pseudoliparis swirei]|uniref:lebercilin n=1 Tax=Pseudoliparis swirei TaxID=2059687 RepID=UPI0024BDF543|nr:lebercilin [Pseudoliparis swirei]